MRRGYWVLLVVIFSATAVCARGGRASADVVCGNGVVEGEEECDDGGTCIGGSNTGTRCVSEGGCIGNGVCLGGPKAETACADSSACPGGVCRHCVPQGGDGCAANCSNETQITVSVLPGHVSDSSLDPGTSGATIWNEVLGPLALAFQPGTTETVAIGKERNGIVPAVVLSRSVHFPRIDVQGLACACVRSVATKTCGGILFNADDTPATDCTPGFTAGDSMCTGGLPCAFVYGEGSPGSGGNSGSGIISCVDGLQGVDLLFTEDSQPAGGLPDPPLCDPSSIEFVPGLGSPVCGQAPQITLTGTGPAGSAVLLNTVTIGQENGPCSAQSPTYCTEADAFSERGIPSTVSSVTGTAAAMMFNINNVPGDTLCSCPPVASSCDVSQCVMTPGNPNGALIIAGQPLPSCSSLQASPPNVTGLGLAGAFASLSNAEVGDIVVTSLLIADGITTPAPTNTPAPTPTPHQTRTCPGDCNGDHVITVDELLTGISIALGNTTLEQCPSFDTSGDGLITVDELLSAVNNALNGCPLS